MTLTRNSMVFQKRILEVCTDLRASYTSSGPDSAHCRQHRFTSTSQCYICVDIACISICANKSPDACCPISWERVYTYIIRLDGNISGKADPSSYSFQYLHNQVTALGLMGRLQPFGIGPTQIYQSSFEGVSAYIVTNLEFCLLNPISCHMPQWYAIQPPTWSHGINLATTITVAASFDACTVVSHR